MTHKTMHLFAGAGGGILADLLLGHRPTVAVEINRHCRDALVYRWAEGYLPDLKEVCADVTTFDGTPYRGIDGVCAGFPCQDVSAAACPSRTQRGVDGHSTGLVWHAMRIIAEAQPRWVFLENSPRLAGLGLDRILQSLADLGFDAEWTTLSAEACGAPHRRSRLWLLAAHPDRQGQHVLPEHAEVAQAPESSADAHRQRREEQRQSEPAQATLATAQRRAWWGTEPGVPRVDHGVAARVERNRALGNGQVPIVAAVAWMRLAARLGVLK